MSEGHGDANVVDMPVSGKEVLSRPGTNDQEGSGLWVSSKTRM